MIRFWADCIANQTNVEYRIEIHDSAFSGTAQKMKGTGSGWLTFAHQQLDPKNITETPIQKGRLKASLWLRNQDERDLLSDILGAQEDRFSIIYKVDSTTEWEGALLPDLTSYEEDQPARMAIEARDLSNLKEKIIDLGLISSRSRLSEVIADCLKQTGLTIPIRSYTNITNENVTTANDFLFEFWHENRAFFENERQRDAISIIEDICRTYNLVIYQSGHRWIIEQLPAVAKGDDVQFDYDSDGLNPTSSTPSRSVQDAIITINSENRTSGALKKITSQYNHRTLIFNFSTEPVDYTTGLEPIESFSRSMDGEGIYNFGGSCQVEAELSDDNPAGSILNAYIRVIGEISGADDVYLTDSGSWTTSQTDIDITLTGSGSTVTGSFDMTASNDIPSDVVSLRWEFLHAEMEDDVGTGVTVEETHYSEIKGYVYNTAQSIVDESATTNHIYERTGNYSLSEEISETQLGSGPFQESVGAVAGSSTGLSTVLLDGFIVRGESTDVTLEELILREGVSVRRSAIRLLEADMIADAQIRNLIEYDGEEWYILGDEVDAYTGRHTSNLLLLKYSRDDSNDTYTITTESGGSPSGSSTTGGGTPGGTGGGLTKEDADGLYFQQDLALGELATADIDTALTNLGLKGGNRDLDLNSVIAQNSSGGWFTARVTDDSRSAVFSAQDSGSNPVGRFFVDGMDGAGAGYLEVGGFDRVDFGQDITTLDIQSGEGYDKPGFIDRWIGVGDDDNRSGVGILGNRGSDDTVGSLIFGNEVSGETDMRIAQVVAQRDGHDNAGLLNLDVWDSTPSQITALQLRSDGGTLNVDLTASSAGFIANRGSGDWFTGHISNDSDSNVYSIKDSGGNVIGNLGARNLDGAGAGNLRIGETDYLDINAPTEIQGTLTLENTVAWTTPSFSTGFLGNGSRVYEEASEYHFETDVGFFRSALFANEFIINQILATQGSRIAGPGRGKIEAVISDTSGSEVVEVSDPEGNEYAAFAENDLILCLQVRNDLDIGTTNVLEDSGGVIVKRYVRRVTDVTTNEVTFTTPGDAPSDAAGPAQGDVIVAFGNTTDTSRQNLLYETVIEPNSPYTVLKQGIDSWTAYKAASNTRMKYGNLNQSYGYASDTFGMAVGPPDSDHATFDPDNGVRFIDGSGNVGAQFNSNTLTVGDSFSYDAVSDVLNVGNFTVNTDYLTDGDVYIGNEVNRFLGEGTMVFGYQFDGNTPTLRLRGPNTTNGSNQINMVARSGAGDTFFSMFADGDNIINVASDEALFFGATINHRGMWSPNNGGIGGGGFQDSGLYINWDAELMSMGDVFSFSPSGSRIAGAYFDANSMWGFPSGYGGDTSDKGNAGVLVDWSTSSITIDNGGELTNIGGDFTIDQNGYQVSANDSTSFRPERSYTMYDGATLLGALYANEIGGSTVDQVQLASFNGHTIDITCETVSDPITLGNPLQVRRMSTTLRDSLSGVEAGWIIYNTSIDQFQGYDGSTWKDITQ